MAKFSIAVLSALLGVCSKTNVGVESFSMSPSYRNVFGCSRSGLKMAPSDAVEENEVVHHAEDVNGAAEIEDNQKSENVTNKFSR